MSTHSSVDNETGERVRYAINTETGELQQLSMHRRNTFQVPRTLYANSITVSQTRNQVYPHRLNSHKRALLKLKEDIMMGYHTTSHRLILIPASMIFPPVVVVIIIAMEIMLHIFCHKKNKRLQDSNLYYRSPLHLITSQFCAVCRESNASDRVGQMQDRRRSRYEYYIRNVVS